MRLRGVWRGFVAPRHRVDVEAIAGIARTLGWKVDREFQRRKLRGISDNTRSDLIRSCGEPDFNSRLRAVVSVNAGQPRRRSPRMIAGAVTEGVRLKVCQAADNVQVTLDAFKRFQRRRKFKAGTGRGGRPLVLNHAIRNIDKAESRRGPGLRGERGNHGVKKGKSKCRSRSSQKCSPGKGLLCDEHCELLIGALLSSETERF